MKFGLPYYCPYCRRDISLLSPEGASTCPFCNEPVWQVEIGGKFWYYSSEFRNALFRPKYVPLPDFSEFPRFKEFLLASGLVASDQLDDPNEPANRLAERLIRSGDLTCWQCWRLCRTPAEPLLFDGYKLLDTLQEVPSEIDLCADDSGNVVLKFPGLMEERGLYRELSMVRRANSGSIVECRGTKMVRGRVCLLREYADGLNLEAIALPIELAVYAIYEAAKALQELHDAGFVHRRIRPQKILFLRNGGVKLLGTSRSEPWRGARRDAAAKMDAYNLLRTLGCLIDGYSSDGFLPAYDEMRPCFDVEFTRWGSHSSLIAVCEDCIADSRGLSPHVLADKLSAWLADYDPLKSN